MISRTVLLCWIASIPLSPDFIDAQEMVSAESLAVRGSEYFRQARYDSAAAMFSRVLQSDPQVVDAHIGLGRIATVRGDVVATVGFFERADELAPNRGIADFGRGLADERLGEIASAADHYRKAYWTDKRNPEYSVALGRILEVQGISTPGDIRRRYKRALDLDSTFAPAHLAMAHLYDREGKYHLSIKHFTAYLDAVPDDPNAVLDIALSLYQRGRATEARELLARSSSRIPPDRVADVVMLGASCHLEERHFDDARRAFGAGLSLVPKSERALYDDVRLIASPDEVSTMDGLRSDGVADGEIARRFWNRHDPTPATEVNERQLAHYQRVWYARQRFSRGREPWDDRAEVLIRFGKPLHLREDALRRDGPQRSPVAMRTGGKSSFIDLVTNIEVWRYPGIGPNGLTITFDDSYATGSYSYTIPDAGAMAASEMLALKRSVATVAPETALRNMTDNESERWTYDDTRPPFPFTYYHAQFQSMESIGLTSGNQVDSVDVLLCYGIPLSEVDFRLVGDTTVEYKREARIERGYAAFDDEWQLVGRSSRHLVMESVEDAEEYGGILQVDQQTVRFHSDERLHLNIQIHDLHADRLGILSETIDTYSFGNELSMSDVVLAAGIREIPGAAPNSGRDGLQIVPLVTRILPIGDPLYIYFEIYNLTRGADYGETQYEMEHSVKSEGEGGLLSAVGRIFNGQSSVGIGTVLSGVRNNETHNFKLTTDSLVPGEYTLTIVVHDLNAGSSFEREQRFTIVE
jgi:GWxTD domain-containing protein